MTTCNDLYATEPEARTKDISTLWGHYYSHMPEIDSFSLLSERARTNERVEIRTLKHVDFDGRRFWDLSTVWLDDRPVMVTQNAGREGDDHAERFITDWAAYREMVDYLDSLCDWPRHLNMDAVDPSEHRKDLDRFYGESIVTAPAEALDMQLERQAAAHARGDE